MAEIIPINLPDLAFNFDHEALTAAVNEACGYRSEPIECSIEKPCQECLALAVAVRGRLVRAFLAGQASMVPASPVVKQED